MPVLSKEYYCWFGAEWCLKWLAAARWSQARGGSPTSARQCSVLAESAKSFAHEHHAQRARQHQHPVQIHRRRPPTEGVAHGAGDGRGEHCADLTDQVERAEGGAAMFGSGEIGDQRVRYRLQRVEEQARGNKQPPRNT